MSELASKGPPLAGVSWILPEKDRWKVNNRLSKIDYLNQNATETGYQLGQ